MSKLQNRVKQLEKDKLMQAPARIFVVYEGEDTGQCDGAPMSRTEFERTAAPQDVMIVIQYASQHPERQTGWSAKQ